MSKQLISSRFPYIPLHLNLKLGKREHVAIDTEALVDTGFTGDLAVPAAWIKNGHRPDGYVTWMMADGSDIWAPIYLGTVRLPDLEEGKPILIPLTITVLGNEVIAGRGLIDHFKLIFDHGRKLIVEL